MLVFIAALLSHAYAPYVVPAALIIGGFRFLKGRKYWGVSRVDKFGWKGFTPVEATAQSHDTGIYKFALPGSTGALELPIG
ncbi:unnamed protein product [Tuber aestivum]|uniref:Uncharacterized protein n=1 Tax=Tuber aestivum TaxID=59557 RepID=A0A292PYZ4_9PEZI|nr:unnamed protein product [Tuber aestivum]